MSQYFELKYEYFLQFLLDIDSKTSFETITNSKTQYNFNVIEINIKAIHLKSISIIIYDYTILKTLKIRGHPFLRQIDRLNIYRKKSKIGEDQVILRIKYGLIEKARASSSDQRTN
ncbi:unnamed protein product [Paramecium sonneborni]|uniref:Uncharacterized protein n=1 Tax=Paramecium sonneborni TaxID=65129 RepID=A0A8S1RQ91_9CILI|nr:unnamed protein product [Paramecium sonneborni]